MANYDSNYAIAQEISARIGVSPIPFDSVYSIALKIYNELGGEPAEFDSVYSILLGILPLVEGGIASKVIDDSVITTVKTWSSSKLSGELATKQNTLTAGTNIDITNDTISAKGYTYDVTIGSIKQHNVAYNDDSSTEDNNIATGKNCAVFGQGNTASSMCTFVVGENNSVSSSHAVAAGYGNTVSKSASVAFGRENTVEGQGSFAEGYKNKVTAHFAHAEGGQNTAAGQGSHAEGKLTQATGIASHAEGQLTKATDYYAHAEGNKTNAGFGCHAEGFKTTAQNQYEHAEGTSNYSHTSGSSYGNAGNTQHSVGIGGGFDTEADTRKNAFEIMQNGDMYVLGIGGYQGRDTKVQDATIKTLQGVITDINTSVAGKQDTLTAGTNITISGTTISATYEVATTADIEALFS